MSDLEANSCNVVTLHPRKEYAGIPDLGVPPREQMYKLANFLLDRREEALRLGRHKQAARLLEGAWRAYFRGR